MAVAGKKIYRQNEARKIVLSGMQEVATTVSSTFGPRGRTVAFDRGGNVKITKDGITVAKEIKFSDEAKNFGAVLIKEAAGKSNYINGDGSTSTTILTYELCKEAYKLLIQGIDINDLREGYKEAKDYVIKKLEDYKHEIEGEDQIFNIAKVSANGDEEIAKNIQQAFLSIGDNGIVSIADSLSRKGETTVKIATGLEFDRGFLSSLSVNSANDQCILNDAKVLLSANVIDDVEDIKAILQGLQLAKKDVVIIAPDFTDEVMAFFRELLSKKVIQGSLVLAPGTSKNTINDNLLDLAVMLDAQILGQDFDTNEFKDDCLGEARQIIISKGKTIIIDAKTNEERFNKHIELLQAKVNHDSAEIGYSEYEIESVKERIAKMSGGVATIYVGGLTIQELGEKKDRYEDAINAVRSSLRGGYIPGAGTALLRIASSDNLMSTSTSMNLAIKAFMKAMKTPAKVLINSSGHDYDNVINEILKDNVKSIGFDSRSGELTDLIKKGIIDPFAVIVNSVIYAHNMAEQFMSVDSVIITDVPNLRVESLDDILNEDGLR